jgi:hypothetical protein
VETIHLDLQPCLANHAKKHVGGCVHIQCSLNLSLLSLFIHGHGHVHFYLGCLHHHECMVGQNQQQLLHSYLNCYHVDFLVMFNHSSFLFF